MPIHTSIPANTTMSDKKPKKTDGKEMSFWDHLDELRGVLFHSAIVIVILMAVAFGFKDFVFGQVIFAPTTSDFPLYNGLCKLGELLGMSGLCVDPFEIKVVNIQLASQFFTHMSVSFWIGFLVGFPYLLYELWRFVRPALFPNEKKHIKLAFGFGGILFFMGVLLGYYLIFPLTLKFLGTYQLTDDLQNQISLSSYISTFTWLILIMGLVFELPMLALVLSKIGVLHKGMLRKYRKYAVLIIFVVSAVITPTGDAFTLCMIALPILMLYEFSIFLVQKKPKEKETKEVESAETTSD
ncbi:MAG: twin-arginine translocase subunit TatC [Prevotellaceae bacterium]|nr:twin-arginine translocase subunit TatC [Prevotellaceae bacterium]